MFSRLREPFGKAGLIVAVVALVAAMVGGAYAANSASSSGKRHSKKAHHKKKKSKYVITNTKQIKPNVLKQLQGNAGPAGPQGPAGANGNDGSNGSNGEKGAQGIQGVPGPPGSNGSNGADGKSVLTASFTGGSEPAGNPCNGNGGVEVEVEESGNVEFVCNGETGPEGPEGSPWTAGGTLPPGATETGTYAVNSNATEPSSGTFEPPTVYGQVSFPIRLAAPIQNTHIIGFANSTECPGTYSNPKALPGNLCFYKASTGGFTFEGIAPLTGSTTGATPAGGDLVFAVTAKGPKHAFGSWAVTAWEQPIVTGISPDHGPAAGANAVTITGENLTGATKVFFGTSELGTLDFTVNAAGTEISIPSAPAGTAGEVDVSVQNPAGTSEVTSASKYTYE